MNKHIILMGLPGSGKSTVGQALAQKNKLPFIDLDQRIEAKQQMAIKTIFERFGESYFRQLEWQTFVEVLSEPQSYIALGGGLVPYAVKTGYDKPFQVYGIYLNSSIDRLIKHLSSPGELDKRPLLTDDKAKLEVQLMTLRTVREPAYKVWTDEEWLNY